jgi:hypothetical protein
MHNSHLRAFRNLLDKESDRGSRMCSVQNPLTIAVALASAEQTVCEPLCNRTPCDTAARGFLQLNRMLASLDSGMKLKANTDGRLCVCNLLIKLPCAILQRENGRKL